MSTDRMVNRLLDRMGELPPLPQMAQRALALLRNPDFSISELASILSMDQAMASLVLRWANSSYYGLKYPVSTVQHAVACLGTRTLHSLLLAGSVASLLGRPSPGYALERGDLWRHAIGVAAGARLICQKLSFRAQLGPHIAEEAYHAGLLCDIGKLAFDVLLHQEDTSRPDWQGHSFDELETVHFGVDHALLGAEMARRWNLPRDLVDAIANHHHPSRAGEGAVLAVAVHLADAAMMMLGIGVGRDGLQYQIDPYAVQNMAWSDDTFQELIDRVLPFINEAESIIQTRR